MLFSCGNSQYGMPALPFAQKLERKKNITMVILITVMLNRLVSFYLVDHLHIF